MCPVVEDHPAQSPVHEFVQIGLPEEDVEVGARDDHGRPVIFHGLEGESKRHGPTVDHDIVHQEEIALPQFPPQVEHLLLPRIRIERPVACGIVDGVHPAEASVLPLVVEIRPRHHDGLVEMSRKTRLFS